MPDETTRAIYRGLVPGASEDAVDWLVFVFETLTAELGYKAAPWDLTRSLLPILAGLGFNWPLKEQMNIRPRLKK